MHRFFIALAVFVASCSCSDGGPTAGGPTPYVRCAAAEPAVVDRQVGALHVRSEGRMLTIEGATAPLRAAVFRGPALADEPLPPALDAIEALRPEILLLLGSVGEDAGLEALVSSLSELPMPTLVVLGGRDHQDALARAIAALPASTAGLVVDASPFRSVRVAGIELIPVAGAPLGRYAQDDRACGLGTDEVDAIVHDLPESPSTRFLVGFAAPSPLPGIEAGEAGSPLVRDLASRASATGGLFAWPDVPMDSPSAPSRTARLLAPPLVGPSTVLSDGSRLPSGPRLVELSPDGLRGETPH